MATTLPYKVASALARGRLDTARGTWRPSSDDFREAAHERATTLKAVFLGAAGLLPSQRKPRKAKGNVAKGLQAGEENAAYDLEWLAEEYGPSPRPDWLAARYAEELERRWETSRRTLETLGAVAWGKGVMSEKEWVFARLRPTNYPTRRIAGAARLLVRLLDVVDVRKPAPPEGWAAKREPGLAYIITDSLSDTTDTRKTLATLRALFELSVPATQVQSASSAEDEGGVFWAGTLRFQPQAKRLLRHRESAHQNIETEARTKSGRTHRHRPCCRHCAQRSFAFCLCLWYERTRQKPSYRRSEFISAYPPLAGNELIETMARQVFGGFYDEAAEGKKRPWLTYVTTAQRQQGLIGLHHSYCAERNCGECPLSGS